MNMSIDVTQLVALLGVLTFNYRVWPGILLGAITTYTYSCR